MKVTVTGKAVVLVKIPEILPEPLATIPVTVRVLSLVQLNTVPATKLLNSICCPFSCFTVGTISVDGFGVGGPDDGGRLNLIPVIKPPEQII